MQEQFDAIVIGAGQGGPPLAKAMAAKGWKTALVERRYLGGVCTNDGCHPTKTLAASAHVAALARRAKEFGISCPEVRIDFAAVMQRQQKMVLAARQGAAKSVAVENLEVICGEASFAEAQVGGSHCLDIHLPEGTWRQVAAPRIFINTGARPGVPELDGLAQVPFLDSTSILQLQQLPEHLLILGAGYIAVEFGQMFRRFGARVTMVERGPQILAHEDDDIAECLTAILREEGVEILTDTMLTSVSSQDGKVRLHRDGQEPVEGSHLLIAAGRVPNTEALHLGSVGGVTDKHGYIQVNERLETNVEGIWALGDVTSGPPYTHIAFDDFRVLRANLLEGGSSSTAGRLVPYCIFTDPELGRVGITEKEASAADLDFEVLTAPMSAVARAYEMSETRGMMKAIVEKGSGRLLGAAVLSASGGETITSLQLAMLGSLRSTTLKEGIFIHPVLAEGLHALFAKA